jgi:squalene synthase HpnC
MRQSGASRPADRLHMIPEETPSVPPQSKLDQAFAHCEARVRAHYENFPVGLFVPREKRPYVHALYAFARAADDFADEPTYEGMRAEKLDEWEARLHAAYQGRAEDPIFLALSETVSRLDIPKALLLDLLSAFRQDTVKRRYDTWQELLDYCRRSADPVGRLLLLVFGYRDPELLPLSDGICSGLQLANHWQDIALDLQKDRIYVPREIAARHGVDEDALRAGRVDQAFGGMMGELVERARGLFALGRPLCDRLGRDLRFEIRLTWLGGSAILDRIEAAGYDVFRSRPHHGALDKARLAWRAWRWAA